MAGKARNIPQRNEPDSRLYEFAETVYNSLSASDVNTTTENKAPNNRYLKLRGGIMESITGQIGRALTISSGVLYLWKDGTDDIIPRALINIASEGGSSSPDTLDLIDINDMEISGARITLWGFISAGHEITITHNATASGTGKNIYCPGNIDYTLKEDEFIDLIWTGSRWHIQQSSIYGSLEVRTTENIEAGLKLYRNDSTPADNNLVGSIEWAGNDSAGNETTYAEITGLMQDVTNSTEDGGLRLRVREGGTMVSVIDMDANVKNMSIRDQWNFDISTSTGTKIGTASGQKLGFWGVTPVIQRSAYTVTNHITDRSYNANSTTVAELADVLGTLIVDLRSIGIVQ